MCEAAAAAAIACEGAAAYLKADVSAGRTPWGSNTERWLDRHWLAPLALLNFLGDVLHAFSTKLLEYFWLKMIKWPLSRQLF